MSSSPSTPTSFSAVDAKPQAKRLTVAVCAMDNKARSKPMRSLLNRLRVDFEILLFGDKVILDEEVQDWPICNFLIAFFSNGFPLRKAIDYVKLRNPYCVNDLELQQVLLDRRCVLSVLDAIDVSTPRRLIVNRSQRPDISADVAEKVRVQSKCDLLKGPFEDEDVTLEGDDVLVVDGRRLEKPFVEKPCSSEDHNINIYYASKVGGGVRRLFRKVANESSRYDPGSTSVRDDGAYVYEEFMDVDNAEDVKVYTIGPDYAYAETRKSPVIDGLVRRNADGKEIRYITELTPEEREMAKKICLAFGQTVCGFDLLRANGKSYVIDVNGWSFVKGSDEYYDNCAEILRNRFALHVKQNHEGFAGAHMNKELSFENSWRLKAFIAVFRHGDRTPKQKLKFNVHSKVFVDLLNGGKEEVILKTQASLKKVHRAAELAAAEGVEDVAKLEQLKMILEKKSKFPGTKVQIKPTFGKTSGVLEKLLLIVKWGGEFTHAGRHHSHDLGENLRNDLTLLNAKLFDDVKMYTSSERRVVATADTFGKSFLDVPELPKNFLLINRDMLDDSNAAKEHMERVKVKLQKILNPGFDERKSSNPDIQVSTSNLSLDRFLSSPEVSPSGLVDEIRILMNTLRDTLRKNFDALDVDQIQAKWCCSESPHLFRERWEKMFKDICDVERSHFDPSKVSELYDSLKYDALHNRAFVEGIFGSAPPSSIGAQSPSLHSASPAPPASGASTSGPSASPSLSPSPSNPSSSATASSATDPLKLLYQKAKLLFDLIAPQEFGIEDEDKLKIGILTSLALTRKLLQDLESAKTADGPCTRLYFTKECHIHTLLNIVFFCGLPIKIPKSEVTELDYLTQITFELYERNRGLISEEKEYSLRVGFSPGAQQKGILDIQMDGRHALSVVPRRDLTDHVSLSDAFGFFKTQLQEFESLNGKSGIIDEEADEVGGTVN